LSFFLLEWRKSYVDARVNVTGIVFFISIFHLPVVSL